MELITDVLKLESSLCFVSPLLPYEETTTVCDIKLKSEVKILTGNTVHCIKNGNTLLVSQKLYEKIKENITPW